MIPIVARKVKYLNNRDMLAEIHRSKCTYSSFKSAEFHQHDTIVANLNLISEQVLETAKLVQAKRIGLAAFTAARAAGDRKIKLAECIPAVDSILKINLVIRIMSFDHIPLAPGRKKTTKTTADSHEKVNFPPFQHWKFNVADELVCVGKSHWKGDVDSGAFSKEHGRITENLGRMFLKLTERYAQKSNWRGYTYIDEMKGQAILQLSQIGLQFDESKSENPFAYYTATLTNSFTRVLNLEKKSQNIRDDILEENGLMPSLTRQNSQGYAVEIARQAKLYKNMRMPRSEESDIDEDQEQDISE